MTAEESLGTSDPGMGALEAIFHGRDIEPSSGQEIWLLNRQLMVYHPSGGKSVSFIELTSPASEEGCKISQKREEVKDAAGEVG